MSDYITEMELRTYVGDSSTIQQDNFALACTAASRVVEDLCDRYFYQDVGVTPRFYWPDTVAECATDDISTTTGLLVAHDTNGDGTYSEPWTLNTDYFVEPVNPSASGVTVPYRKIHATLQSKFFFQRTGFSFQRPPIRVTAQWGWPAVPDKVKEACLVAANELLALPGAPLGTAGFDQFGVVRIKDNWKVRSLLGRFMIAPIAVA